MSKLMYLYKMCQNEKKKIPVLTFDGWECYVRRFIVVFPTPFSLCGDVRARLSLSPSQVAPP